MAFNSEGLFLTQFAAALEYAEDQNVSLEDFKYNLPVGEHSTSVEVYFSHPERIKPSKSSEVIIDTRIKFVTMFQSIVYRYRSDDGVVIRESRQQVDSDFTPLGFMDQLRLLALAIEHSTL